MSKISFVFFLLFILSGTFLSCKKGCDFPEDSNKGDIVPESVINGFNTAGVRGVYYQNVLGVNLEMSFNKGQTYVPVDYNKYTVMNFPATVGCNTHFEREVKIDHSNNKVTYTLTTESCPDCEDLYSVDNWVLVEKFPKTYQVSYIRKK